MEVVSFSLRLADGRSLDVEVSGPAGGTPLVVHHGTPGERSQYPPFAGAAAARGLRYVSYSRPGYDRSSRQPGRAVAACAADTAAILAHLGAGRCYTVGASGGGPHALACAALLPDQVLACATVAGVGPFGAEDLDFLAGMARENHEEFGAAQAGEPGATGRPMGTRPACALWPRSRGRCQSLPLWPGRSPWPRPAARLRC
jgi:pimeloyl-ACP methyl ester carboxylesterase